MLNRWPVRLGCPAAQLRSELDRALSEAFGDFVGGRWVVGPTVRRGRGYPAVNVWEDEEVLRAEAEVPGLEMGDLEILVRGNELTLKGERKHEAQEGVTYHRRGRIEPDLRYTGGRSDGDERNGCGQADGSRGRPAGADARAAALSTAG